MYRPRILRPIPSCALTQPGLSAMLEAPLTVVAGRRVVAHEGNVARTLHDAGVLRHTAWLRLSSLDRHPAHLAHSLQESVGELDGRKIELMPALLRMIRRLSQEFCWAIGEELAAKAPCDAALVVEGGGADNLAALVDVLVGWTRQSTGRRAVILWHGRIPRRVRPLGAAVLGPRHLGIDIEAVRRLVVEPEAGDDWPSRRATLPASARSAALLHDVLDRAAAAGIRLPAGDAELLMRPGVGLHRLVRQYLRDCMPPDREALAVALGIGYWHPSMGTEGDGRAPLGPWFVPLDEGWWRLRPQWRRVLRHHARYARYERRGVRRHGLQALPRGTASPRRGPAPAVAIAARRPVGTPAALPEAPPWQPAAAPFFATGPAAAVRPSGGRGHGTLAGAEPAVAQLTVKMLGAFHVAVNGREVPSWDGAIGVNVFKYLLVNRDRPCTRDALMDVFWPDASPEQARNRFHAAMGALRRSLRTADDTPVIEFRDGLYTLHPGLDVWIDVEAFEAAVASGRRSEAAGDRPAAVIAYTEAVELYRGDLLADTPYDDWAMLKREALRVAYLDVLDRLIALHLSERHLDRCVELAHLVLRQDPCREDAHRLLMRCHVEGGRPQQALRQFELCVKALARDLDAPPSGATVELWGSIRASLDAG